jgi:hypothetical protein
VRLKKSSVVELKKPAMPKIEKSLLGGQVAPPREIKDSHAKCEVYSIYADALPLFDAKHAVNPEGATAMKAFSLRTE